MSTERSAEYQPKNGTVEDDLRSRLACIAEASYWDRGYDDRLAAIRGMCDLSTNGLTPEPWVDRVETPAERDERLHAWLATVSPGDIVTVYLNSTDTLTGKVYEAPDARGTSLCVWTTVLRHGNGYPGSSFEPLSRPAGGESDA
ncbi:MULTISPECIES: hypothetical protein [unclassified Nocardioides]|uniref:hypothetical protein n=1 Tax=unclassified Nocardioides TaxID=2615069 RepID=UPI0009EF92B4|nr:MULTISPECIES: hypothetical protein [unclassified Nocardioides]GAW50579.1 hypothetical protein PD653B2_2915 [Nocardioides sp. PD653-B2]GAW57464.1 hypothetical protein PD653_4909 [Nocardioides sp. PD653]